MGVFVCALFLCSMTTFFVSSAEPVVYRKTLDLIDDDADNLTADDAHNRSSRQELVLEGRGKKKGMMKTIMLVKMLAVSFLLPKIIGLTLFASWKGITLSLIALTVAVFAAIKASASTPNQTPNNSDNKGVQHIFLKTDSGASNNHHEHWWRRIRDPAENQGNNHHSKDPYRGWND